MAASLRNIWSKSQSNILFHRVRPIISQGLKTTSCALGLEEFFPAGVLDKGELAPEIVKTGRRWRAGELRIKSNEDLHKLWYVLLKERNMLNTLMHEAKRQGVPMPSPERYHKVKKSMAIIKLVIGEREIALKGLENQVWEVDKTAELELTEKTLLSNNEELSSERQEEVYLPQAVTLQMSETEILEQTSTNLEVEKPTSLNLLKPT